MKNDSAGTTAVGRTERIVLTTMFAVIVTSFISSFIGTPGNILRLVFIEFIHDALMVAGAGLCFVGASRNPRERVAWSLFGMGLIFYAAGDIIWTVIYAGVQPVPQVCVSDLLWLLWYPCTLAGIVVLVRARVRYIAVPEVVDGVILGVVAATISLIFLFFPVMEHERADGLAMVVSVSYPIGDILLICTAVAVLAILGWRTGLSWNLLVLGLVANGIADAIYARQTIDGVYIGGTWVHAMWPLTVWLISWASLVGAPVTPGKLEFHDWESTIVPVAIFASGIAIEFASMAHAYHNEFTMLVKWLVVISLALGILRTVLVPITHRVSASSPSDAQVHRESSR